MGRLREATCWVGPSTSSSTLRGITIESPSPTVGLLSSPKSRNVPLARLPRWKQAKSLMTLDAVEFIRRYLLHVLPFGFCEDQALRIPSESEPPCIAGSVEVPRPGQPTGTGPTDYSGTATSNRA